MQSGTSNGTVIQREQRNSQEWRNQLQIWTQLKFLNFTRTKGQAIVQKQNTEGIKWHRDALQAIIKTVENQKLQNEQAKFANAEAPKYITTWSSEIEEQQATIDEQIAQLHKRLTELILGSTLEAMKCEEELAEQVRDN